jgi:hypothetical protein
MAVDECFIFFAADADIGVFLALEWPIPRHVIDPRVEFMRIRNGLPPLPPYDCGDPVIAAEKETKRARKQHKKPGRFSLSRITHYYDVPFISDEEKGEFRDLAMRIENMFTDIEQRMLITYCRGDVDATAEVFRRMWLDVGLSDPSTLNQALFRGFYMAASAWVTHVGIPLDLPLYQRFSMNAGALRSAYIALHANHPKTPESDRFDVFEDGHFDFDKFEFFLRGKGWLDAWPRTPKGRLAISGKALQKMIDRMPDKHQREAADKLMAFLATVDLLEGIGTSFNEAGEIEWDSDKAKGLRICPDGRNRAPLFPFSTKTSRNAPGGRAFLYTNSAWMRFLVTPPERRALAYLDWSAQELRIAAALSKDPALLALCEREDPYIELAISLGLAPPGATKKTHPKSRKIGKVLTLAMLYGAGPGVLMAKTGMGRVEAVGLLRRQRESFSVFFAWSNNFAYRGLSAAPLYSPLGWRFWPRYWKDGTPERTCRNYPVQSCGADIMRVAAILALEAGIAINAIVHDAFLIEAAAAKIAEVAETMRAIMMRATETVIGKVIPVECTITRHGERLYDEDGEPSFNLLMGMLEEIERARSAA